MVDLNTMMREQARMGIQTQMDAAVAEGNAEKVRKLAKDLADFEVAAAPAKVMGAYGADDVKAELSKLPWFGVDPVKSARVMDLGKHMDFKKFANAAAFTEALVKAVENDGKAAPAAGTSEPPENETDEEREAREAEEAEAAEAAAAGKPRRKTDGPNEGDRGTGNTRRASAGPWTKMSDAPAAVQAEIRRTEGKFVSANATKEQREAFQRNALASHYQVHLRNKGKK